ncbi:MAG: hypothetical protein ABIQ93_16620, partial [Saprospiraceae bacterium]
QKSYDFVDDDRAAAIATDAAGNVFVTGQSDQDFGPARNWDLATVAFSKTGSPLWATRYGGSQDEFPATIAADAQGHVFVTARGDSDPGITIDIEIITLSYQAATGTEQWATVYPGLANRDNAGNALVGDGSGGCLVVGYAEDLTLFRNALSLHYSNAGVSQWEKQFNGIGDNNDAVRQLAVDLSGNVYAAGFTVSNGDNRNLTMAHFLSDGSYACRYVENGSAASAIDDAQGMLMSTNGQPIVMGYVKNSGSSNDIYMAKLNALCDTVWQKNLNGGANGSERAYDMSSDGQGNLLLTGRSDQQSGPLSNDVAYTLKVRESDGVTLWVKKYDADSAANRSERGVIVRAPDANQTYVAGRSFNGLDYDVFLLKYDGNGNQLWVQSWSAGTANDEPVDMALDQTGSIFVLANTAALATDNLHDMALLKYDPSGNLLWSAQYNSPANGNDEALALAVDDQGDIVVTGKVEGPPGYGIELLKYANDSSLIWEKTLSLPGSTDQVPDALALRPNGQIYLAGHVNAGTTAIPNLNLLALVLDNNGNVLWSDTYDGPEINGSDIPNTLLLDGNDFYLGGSSVLPGQQRDMLVIKYSGIVVGTTAPAGQTIRAYPNPA